MAQILFLQQLFTFWPEIHAIINSINDYATKKKSKILIIPPIKLIIWEKMENKITYFSMLTTYKTKDTHLVTVKNGFEFSCF